MANEEIVKFIVGTYSLSPKMEEKVTRYAIRGIDEWTIDGFNNIYQYIARIIDGLRVPYAEKKISLDQLITSGSDNVLSTLFGEEDANLTHLLEESELPERITMDEALSILKDYFDESDMVLLHQLIAQGNGSNGILNLSAEKIIRNIDLIKEKFSEIAHEFERDGRLIIPLRKVVDIRFNPLVIRYGNLSDAAKESIREAYPFYKGNASAAAAGLGLSRTTVSRIWRNDGFTPSGRLLSPEKGELIIAAYKTSGGNASEAARRIKCDIHTVLKMWKKKGLIKLTRRLDAFQKYAIYVSYDLYDGNCSEAARMLGITTSLVWQYWEKKGLKTKGRYLSDDKRKKVISAYYDYNGNISAASRSLDCTPNTVRYHWVRQGLIKKLDTT